MAGNSREAVFAAVCSILGISIASYVCYKRFKRLKKEESIEKLMKDLGFSYDYDYGYSYSYIEEGEIK